MMKRILIPVDFSAPSLKALDYAAGLARRRRPKPQLVVLHVVEPVYYPAVGEMYGVGLDLGSVYDEIERAAQAHVARLTTSLRRRGAAARGLICVGAAAQAIVEAAAKLKADLIVLSTHGRTGLSHVVMGSVAERVVRTAPCAVVTVRASARPRRAAAPRRASRRSSAPKSRAGGRRRSAREA
jgi:universal stress protein A